MTKGEEMQELEMYTGCYGMEKEALERLADNLTSYKLQKDPFTPLGIVRSDIEKHLNDYPDEYMDTILKAYGLCLVGKWEGLSDEEYALLYNVMWYCYDFSEELENPL